MKALKERRNIQNSSVNVILKFDLGSITFQIEMLEYEFQCGPVVVAVCQLQDGSRTMTSVVQYAFMALVYPGGKGTRYSD
jgi:hypothetical protein